MQLYYLFYMNASLFQKNERNFEILSSVSNPYSPKDTTGISIIVSELRSYSII